MVQLTLPKNSVVGKGKRHRAPSGAGRLKLFRVYRYDPEGTENPRWDEYEVNVDDCGPMVLDVLIHIKNSIDSTLAFRRSCREGVCGSCAMNIGGRNTLACTHGLEGVPGEAVQVAPLPSQP
ncbi:MAG TPA: 2Fe-2S iron-sulfur cluster-binding protein, partial [Caulobacteraceae bacterium]|nr:2Fe-2S iron-sulfur cluster-binding protein [Caulobacteraceae bacterium]